MIKGATLLLNINIPNFLECAMAATVNPSLEEVFLTLYTKFRPVSLNRSRNKYQRDQGAVHHKSCHLCLQ